MLDLEVVDPETGEITRTVPGRKTELILHIVPPTRPSAGWATPGPRSRSEQIKDWLNLAQHQPDHPPGPRPRRPSARSTPTRSPTGSDATSTAARPPLRLSPLHQTRRACDLDHVVPYAEGGETSAGDLVPELSWPSPVQDLRPDSDLPHPQRRAPTCGPVPTAGNGWSTPPAPTTSRLPRPDTPPPRRGHRPCPGHRDPFYGRNSGSTSCNAAPGQGPGNRAVTKVGAQPRNFR